MLFVYTSTNPCNCSTSSVPSDPPCEDACNCLKLCSITIPSNSTSAVDPCGGQLTIDITDPSYGHETCACGVNPISWYLAYYDDEVFSAASLTIGGDLDLTTVASDPGIRHSNIIVRAVCGNISAYLTIVVGIADLCSMVTCGSNQECNACTGTCVDLINIGTE